MHRLTSRNRLLAKPALALGAFVVAFGLAVIPSYADDSVDKSKVVRSKSDAVTCTSGGIDYVIQRGIDKFSQLILPHKKGRKLPLCSKLMPSDQEFELNGKKCTIDKCLSELRSQSPRTGQQLSLNSVAD